MMHEAEHERGGGCMKRLTGREQKFRNIGKMSATYYIVKNYGFVAAAFRHYAPDEDYIKHGAHVDGKFVLEWKCATCGKTYAANSFSAMRTHANKCKAVK